MIKFTISYGALSKEANLEMHRDDKCLVFRKQFSHTSMEEVITIANAVLNDKGENDAVVFFNGTISDFTKLQTSELSHNAMSIYHAEKFEELSDRLKLIEVLHLEIQNGPYPLQETKEQEYVKYLSELDVLGAGYCLSEHLWSQRQRLKEDLLYSNNFSEQFTDMLGHYLSWLVDLHRRLYKLLD